MAWEPEQGAEQGQGQGARANRLQIRRQLLASWRDSGRSPKEARGAQPGRGEGEGGMGTGQERGRRGAEGEGAGGAGAGEGNGEGEGGTGEGGREEGGRGGGGRGEGGAEAEEEPQVSGETEQPDRPDSSGRIDHRHNQRQRAAWLGPPSRGQRGPHSQGGCPIGPHPAASGGGHARRGGHK